MEQKRGSGHHGADAQHLRSEHREEPPYGFPASACGLPIGSLMSEATRRYDAEGASRPLAGMVKSVPSGAAAIKAEVVPSGSGLVAASGWAGGAADDSEVEAHVQGLFHGAHHAVS